MRKLVLVLKDNIVTEKYAHNAYGDSQLKCEITTFPAGEPHIKITEPKGTDDLLITDVIFVTSIVKTEDLIVLGLAKDVIDRMYPRALKLLHLGFMMGQRQDRMFNINEPFSLKVYTNILNSYNFNYITLLDPHSDVSPALLSNSFVTLSASKSIHVKYLLKYRRENINIVSPDIGSIKTNDRIINCVPKDKDIEISHLKFTKLRNEQGRIKEILPVGFKELTEEQKESRTVIFDDICDGGATFVLVGQKLRDLGAKRLDLCITHGLFTKGVDHLLKIFDNIYYSNTVEPLTQIKDSEKLIKINILD